VRQLEAAGEKFYPRELAALVHNESSILAKKAIRDALDRGDNIIIDGTLSGEKNARAQLDALQAAGYDVKIADVETTRAVSEARTLGGTESDQNSDWFVLRERWVCHRLLRTVWTGFR
jgi:predicted kinase